MKPVSTAEDVRVTTPVKAHLTDGFTIVYPDGITVSGGRILGVGKQFDLTLTEVGTVAEIPLERVVALESFEATANREMTVLASGGATVALLAGGALLAVAIFGSCPTVYADADGEGKLEAELFSYSIAPLFEMPDTDRLQVRPGSDGAIRLEVRNEALETHYLNQLQVTEARHAPGEIVVPDEKGEPLALSELSTPAEVFDRGGRDLRAVVASRDDQASRTHAETMAGLTSKDLRDSIELRVPVDKQGQEVALLLRMRNSLLNTVLFYETMLKGSGARSLDWLGKDLGEPGPAIELATWYASRMGMRVEVWQDGEYRSVARLGDTGPIAWKDVAVILPAVPNDGTLRVRLSFPADNWRIDHLQIAKGVRRPETRDLPIAEVVSSDGKSDPAAARSLASTDERYLRTSPGQSFSVRFNAGPDPAARTFLLESRGYYTEWIRGSWVGSPTRSAAFTPSDDALLEAMMKWRDVQSDFEARFDATRIPVR
ncbi:MAG TPA: hypothetical protein VFL80_07670 [Thermoanaerobaculia bacterium]|nr:hypothetical protein [Thermoanaerobaculia bacterium]